MSEAEKESQVNAIIDELGLNLCADSRIGIDGSRGISGGERKRTSIGVELITDPSLLFLDEPTSGLDAFTAFNLTKTLVRVARAGRTVVATIHQPRANIFALFDKLLILSAGKTVYFGPTSEAIHYFADCGFYCPSFTNPADYFMDITTVDNRKAFMEASTNRVQALITNYANSTIAADLVTEIDTQVQGQDLSKEKSLTGYAAGQWTQFKLLFQRSYRNTSRSTFLTTIRYVTTAIMATLIGLIYFQIPLNQESIQDRTGLLFFLTLNQSFPALIGAINAFPAERRLFYRERAAGMYTTASYFLAKSVSEFPVIVSAPILFVCINYWLTGLQLLADRFFLMILILMCTALSAQSFGLLFSSIFKTPEGAQQVSTLILIVFVLFGGFYQNADNVAVYFVWVPYISFIRWGFEALVHNEFTGLVFTCTPEQELIDGSCPIATGEDVIEQLSLEDASVGRSLIALLATVIVLRAITFRILARKSKERF